MSYVFVVGGGQMYAVQVHNMLFVNKGNNAD